MKLDISGEPLAGTIEGNTTSIVPAKDIRKRFWCGTHFIKSDNSDIIFKDFISKQKHYIYGNEKCPTTGKAHYQFFFETHNKDGIRFSTLHKLMPNTHFEPTKSSLEDNFNYCAKERNYTTNIVNVFIPKLTPDIMYPWQKKCRDIALGLPDERSIFWFWDELGCSGKTCMAKYLTIFHNAIPLRGKTNDILHCASEHSSLLYVFISPRTTEDYFPYEGLELVKDGFFMSGKYESKPICRPSPHVFVFANFEPNLSKCSADRWKVVECAIE